MTFTFPNPNNTNLSDTEMNDNKSNPIISVDEKRFDSDNRSEDYQAYENLVKETIDYESLEVTHHDDMRQVDEIVNLIVETVMCKNDKILIASNWYPASLVKKKFLMLTYCWQSISCRFYTSQFLRSGSRFHLPVAYRHDGLLTVIHNQWSLRQGFHKPDNPQSDYRYKIFSHPKI